MNRRDCMKAFAALALVACGWPDTPRATLEELTGEVLAALGRNDARARDAALAKAKANGYAIACHHGTDEDWVDEPEADVVIWYGCRVRTDRPINKGGKAMTYIMNCYVDRVPRLRG